MCSKRQLNEISDDIIREYRKVYGDAIDKILLFGSYARGEEDSESDIDYVAIVRGDRVELQKQLKEIWDSSAEIGLENDIVVSPTVIPYDEFMRYKDVLPYYRNISKEGQVIG